MGFRLSVEGHPDAGLEELSEWLGQEALLRGLLSTEVVPPQAGQLGALAEVLVVAVGSGGAVSVLAASLKAFLSQPRHADIRIVASRPDGERVEIDAKRVKDVEALLSSVLERPE